MQNQVVKEKIGAEVKEDMAHVSLSNLNVWFGEKNILKDVNLQFLSGNITCIVGPSGSGKSTLIRCINRISDETSGFRKAGSIFLKDRSIDSSQLALTSLRKRVGMVFQKPCVFPCSIEENVTFGLLTKKKFSKTELESIVRKNLEEVALWDEVKDRLKAPASSLSLGQQQRLCIARSLALSPEVLLLDEPTSALDPISTKAIEKMMLKLKEKVTLIFVSHNIQQAKRIADQLVFLCDGELIESGHAADLFAGKAKIETQAYLNDEYCIC